MWENPQIRIAQIGIQSSHRSHSDNAISRFCRDMPWAAEPWSGTVTSGFLRRVGPRRFRRAAIGRSSGRCGVSCRDHGQQLGIAVDHPPGIEPDHHRIRALCHVRPAAEALAPLLFGWIGVAGHDHDRALRCRAAFTEHVAGQHDATPNAGPRFMSVQWG